MATILNKSVFIHIPKTGGTWVMAALEAANLYKFHSKAKHPSLAEFRCMYPTLQLTKMRFFTFVRNPVTWWQSRWSDPFHRQHFIDGLNATQVGKCGSIRWMNYESMMQNQEQFDDFNTYVESILKRRPGFATEYFRFMANVPQGLEIGKYERIAQDLIEILYRVGEDFSMKDILETPRVNESDPELKASRLYKESNLKRLIEAEKRMMDQYGYSTKLDDYAHLIK